MTTGGRKPTRSERARDRQFWSWEVRGLRWWVDPEQCPLLSVDGSTRPLALAWLRRHRGRTDPTAVTQWTFETISGVSLAILMVFVLGPSRGTFWIGFGPPTDGPVLEALCQHGELALTTDPLRSGREPEAYPLAVRIRVPVEPLRGFLANL